jgi:hypothetical protein
MAYIMKVQEVGRWGGPGRFGSTPEASNEGQWHLANRKELLSPVTGSCRFWVSTVLWRAIYDECSYATFTAENRVREMISSF